MITDPIVERIRAELHQRSQVGIAKYKTTLAGNNASFPERMQHLKEELLDGALYVEWILDLHRQYEDDGK